jgi:hypothetical protein
VPRSSAEGEFQASERLKDAATVIAAPDRAAASLPADIDRNQRLAGDDDRLPGIGRRDSAFLPKTDTGNN